MPRIFWVILTAMLAVWLGMNLVTAPKIEEMSGGLRLLDMGVTGYSFEDARNFIAEIGDDGVALYLNRQLVLDMIFPPLLASVLFMSYRWLFPGRTGLIIGTLSLTSVVLDYCENAALAAMLRAGADDLTHEMVASANLWTLSKWSLALVGLAALLIGVLLRLRRSLGPSKGRQREG